MTLVPRRCCPAQAVVDGRTQPVIGDRCDADRLAFGVQRVQVAKEVRRRLDQIAALRQVQIAGTGTKSQIKRSCNGRLDVQPHGGVGRVMRQQLPGCCQRIAVDVALYRASQCLLQSLSRDASGAQQQRFVACQPGNGAFQTYGAGAVIDDGRDTAIQPGLHMRRCSWADPARGVGRRRRDRPADLLQQAPCGFMSGHPHGQRRQSGSDQPGHAVAIPQRQNQGQRSGPEGAGEHFGPIIPFHQLLRCLYGRNMCDQWVETRPPLGRIDPGDGLAIAGITAQAIDGFGRKRDQPTGAQKRGGALQIGLCGAQNDGTFGIHGMTRRFGCLQGGRL